MQSQLVECQRSIAQTKRASLGKDETDSLYYLLPDMSVNTMDFKVREGAENTLALNTVGSFVLMQSSILNKRQRCLTLEEMETKQATPTNMASSYFLHFHYLVSLAK